MDCSWALIVECYLNYCKYYSVRASFTLSLKMRALWFDQVVKKKTNITYGKIHEVKNEKIEYWAILKSVIDKILCFVSGSQIKYNLYLLSHQQNPDVLLEQL